MDAAVIDHDEALLMDSYRSIQQWTGGDDYLTLMVVALRAKFGSAEDAQTMLAAVDVEHIGLAMAHDDALAVSLANDDHPATLEHLVALRDRYGYQLGDLSALEGIGAFLASPHYRRWLGEQ